MRVDNAIIMAAGTSSRFAPLSYERHKAMTLVKGEVLIERQIRQLQEANIPEIYIVTGYKAEQFDYLAKKYDVKLILNNDYLTRNNNASIWAVKDVLGNSYICSSDNYFAENPFEAEVDEAYYAAVYANGHTAEWCMTEDNEGYINSVTLGGNDAWYMLGHTYWNEEFSKRFLNILDTEYDFPETAGKLWEMIFMEHLDILKMKIRKYAPNVIFEFDTLDELREFDTSYVDNTCSKFVKKVAKQLDITESQIVHITPIKSDTTEAVGFEFDCPPGHYRYTYENGALQRSTNK